MKPFLALSALLLLAPTVDCVISKSCPAMGCHDGANGRVMIQASTRDLLASVVTICKNGVCSTGKPTMAPGEGASPSVAEGLDVSMVGPLRANVDLIAQDTTRWDKHFDAAVPIVNDQTARFAFVIDVLSGPFADGDTFVMTIAKDGAAPIVSITKTVTYAAEYPNGPDCGGVCRRASLS